MKYCESHTFRQAIDHALSLRYSHTISGRTLRGTEGSSAKPTNALTEHFVQFPRKSGPKLPRKQERQRDCERCGSQEDPRFSVRRRTVVGHRVIPGNTTTIKFTMRTLA